jgi:hypothetical protein
MRNFLRFLLGRPLSLAVKGVLLYVALHGLSVIYTDWGILGFTATVIGIVIDLALIIYDTFDLLRIAYKQTMPLVERAFRALCRFDDKLDELHAWMAQVYGKEPAN